MKHPLRVPHPPELDINLETFTPLGPLTYIPEFDNVYQEIPEIDETLFQKQPSESDYSLSSNDGGNIECEVEVVVEWNGGSSSPQSSIPGSDDSLNGNEDVSSTPESTAVPDNGRGTGSICSSDSSCELIC